MFGNRINYAKRGWTLTTEAEIEYRSHYHGWQCTCPDNWLSAQAVNEKGDTATIWWYWPDDRHGLDGSDWVRDWSKCNDIVIEEGNRLMKYRVRSEYQDSWYGGQSTEEIGSAIVTEEEIRRLAEEWAQDGDTDAKLAELMSQVEEISDAE